MQHNLIVFAGLSHSGKDLLFGQMMKFAKTEPKLKLTEKIVYFDWLNKTFKDSQLEYLENILVSIREKVIKKINTLIYVHDITYQRLDDMLNDFKSTIAQIEPVNKEFQVVLLLNRGHLIPNEIERNNIQRKTTERFQEIYPKKISSYVVSLKGADEQRLTNLVFSQIVSKSLDFAEKLNQEAIQQIKTLAQPKQKKIREILTEKMKEYGFAGAYLLHESNNILFALGKTKNWEENVGPQIIRVLAKEGAFEVYKSSKLNLLLIEDFLMMTHLVNDSMKLILIGRESNFQLNNEQFPNIEQKCAELAEIIASKL
ncbi:MAG: hypothetical protein ACTSPV_07385 [Candidatus Hodarchaeales archaeon]